MSDDQKTTQSTEPNQGVSQQPATPSSLPGPAGGSLPGLGSRAPGGSLPGLGSRAPGGGLPGLGSRAPGGGLPGLGSKPGGGGLPGLGAKPGGGGLPGLGAKPGGGGLPGMGAKPGGQGPVPAFIQQQQEKERQANMSRDPFASDVLPSASASYAPGVRSDIIPDTGGPVDTSHINATHRKMLITCAIIVGIVFFGFGYGAGLAINQRGLLNSVLRDAWIIQYEMRELRALQGEVQGMVSAALNEAQQKKFNKDHVAFLTSKVSGNPFDARLFTDRNYKSLNPMVVQMMANLFRNWEKLSTLIAEHRVETNNDEKVLMASGEEFQKLLATNYGVIFSRDKSLDGQLVGNIVVLGASSGNNVQIQTRAGSVSDEREIYNPEEPNDRLIADPSKYVVLVGNDSKRTILQNATQSHFNAYTSRLEEMSRLLRIMGEEQDNMMGPLDDNCSREPVSFFARGIDPKAEFEDYIKNKKKAPSQIEE